MDAKAALGALEKSTRRYRSTEKAHDDARKDTISAVVAALQAGVRPTDVVERSPFTASHVRTIAREHGIGPKRKGKQDPSTAL